MTFNIIRHRGDPKKATTLKNRQVARQEQLFVPEWGAFVKCTPYGEHFIYENPDTSAGSSSYLCTCGSAAVVVPPGPKGLFVCQFHVDYGFHQTSVINVKDFEKSAGQTITVNPKGKRWI